MNAPMKIILVVISVCALGALDTVYAGSWDTELPLIDNPQACDTGRAAASAPCSRWYLMTEKENPDACLDRPGQRPCRRWFSVPSPEPVIEPIVLRDVHFDFDSARIKPESLPNLDDDVEALKKTGDSKVIIVGHTDDIGSAEYNEELSKKRAESVMDYFIQQGISPSRMAAEGRGYTQPVATNETEQGRAENRRTELYMN